jgi:hypothetical protein
VARFTVAEEHQIKVAFDTLRMNDAMAQVMGGMSKEQAKNFLLDHDLLAECGCCGCYHPRRVKDYAPDSRFNGGMYECRSDANRF